jgi:hypothetical protein
MSNIREMIIKTFLKFHLTPVKMATIKKRKTRNIGEDARGKRILIPLLGAL